MMQNIRRIWSIRVMTQRGNNMQVNIRIDAVRNRINKTNKTAILNPKAECEVNREALI